MAEITLKNVVKRATLLTDGELIEAKSLPFEIAHFSRLQFDKPGADGDDEDDDDDDFSSVSISYENKLKSANIDAEYEVILGALQQAWSEAAPAQAHAHGADGCDDGSCSI